MYNFLDPKLLPKLKCSAPTTDNYEATNLINENETVRARGFLAYTVTKPPIDIEFEFLCPVDIYFISLGTTVGTQKCTGIEVLAKTASSPYVSIARAVYDKPGLTFCNSKKYSKQHPPHGHNSSFQELCYFKSDTFRVFTHAQFIKIVIFRTARSVPCLASVKVFGRPAKSCSQITVQTIERLIKKTPKATDSCVKQPETKQANQSLAIPNDFIDALTYEIMTIPMTLPSGKTVDRDTIEKHEQSEKSFGRKPGDPFTGLKFTETRKPVLNSALKSRIDMFLLQNSNNPATFALKRCLGGNNETSNCKRVKSNLADATVKCCVCDGIEQLYEILCGHYYCRSCLLALNDANLKCNVCGQQFAKNQAARSHILCNS